MDSHPECVTLAGCTLRCCCPPVGSLVSHSYVFVASQAQQFAWLKRDYPRLFARVKKAVAAGRLVPVGGCVRLRAAVTASVARVPTAPSAIACLWQDLD